MRPLTFVLAALCLASPAAAAGPEASVAAAQAAGRIGPKDAAAVNAILVYPWTEGGLYQVWAAVGRVTDIALEPGERLVGSGPVAAGDTVRWIIGDTESGAGLSRRVHVLVKPTAPGLVTNMLILTDRRTYRLELRSTAGAYMAAVAWRYPPGPLVAVAGRRREPQAVEPPPAAAFDPARLNFDYRIEGRAPFRPVRVFDDGRQVFVDLGEAVGAGEVPPLFVLSQEGKPQLASYRLVGRRYVVDRLFERAELRIGAGRGAQRVRIVRGRAP